MSKRRRKFYDNILYKKISPSLEAFGPFYCIIFGYLSKCIEVFWYNPILPSKTATFHPSRGEQCKRAPNIIMRVDTDPSSGKFAYKSDLVRGKIWNWFFWNCGRFRELFRYIRVDSILFPLSLSSHFSLLLSLFFSLSYSLFRAISTENKWIRKNSKIL